jgi:ligand-binding sensor domain-containing protein
MRFAGCLLLAFVLAGTSAALAERLPVRTFTVSDGLAHNRVKCIVRDSRGLLWVCTGAGIDWFDGQRFTGHGVDDALKVSSNDVLEGPDHTYWIATNARGVLRLDPSVSPVTRWPPPASLGSRARLTRLAVGDTAGSNRVNKLFRDSSGALWAGTDDGVFRLEGHRGFQPVALPGGTSLGIQVWSFAETADGSVWIGTTAGLLRRRPDGAVSHEQIRPDARPQTVWALLAADDGTVWVGDDKGLARAFKPPGAATNVFVWAPVPIVAPGRAVKALCRAGDHAIWIGYQDGPLVRYDGRESQQYTHEHGLPEASIGVLATDADDNLWLSAGWDPGAGVTRILKSGIRSYTRSDGLQHELVQSLIETRAGEVCALTGTDADPWLQCLVGGRFAVVRPRLPAGAGSWQTQGRAIQARDGAWWFATTRGLYRFGPVTALRDLARTPPVAYGVQQGLTGAVSGVFEDARGDIWVWSESGQGHSMWRRRQGTDVMTRVEEFPRSKQVHAITEDTRGNLRIGFRDGGVARWRNDRLEIFGPDGAYRTCGPIHWPPIAPGICGLPWSGNWVSWRYWIRRATGPRSWPVHRCGPRASSRTAGATCPSAPARGSIA